MSIDPTTFAEQTPAEFARMVKTTPDGELKEFFGGEHRRAALDSIFGRFPGLFQADKAGSANARVNFRLTGAADGQDDTYAVVIGDGACTIEKDPTEEPKTSLMMGPVEFCKLITGSGNPVMMVMSGKIKTRGDLSTAMAFQNWFDMPAA